MLISVLQQVALARAAFGARNADYIKYEQHCTQQVASLRKKVGLKRRPPKAGADFDVRPVNAVDTAKLDVRHLFILLWDAERCWAKAQSIKASMTSTGNAEKRHRIGLKLSRAAKHARDLADLLKQTSENNAIVIAEAEAYYAYIIASRAFEKGQDKNKDGLQAMVNAKALLEGISAASTNSAVEATAYEWLEDDIEPMIRVTKHRLNVGDEGINASEGTRQMVKQIENLAKSSRTKKLKHEFHWRGQAIAVRNAKLLAKVNEAEVAVERLERSMSPSSKKRSPAISTYEKTLGVLTEAEDLARSLVEDNQMALERAPSARFEAASVPLQNTREFLAYRLLRIRIARDLQLVHQTLARIDPSHVGNQQKKHANTQQAETQPKTASHRKQAKTYAAVVKLLDGVIGSYEQMQELGLVEKDVELSGGIETRLLAERAQRCYYLAAVYRLLQKFEEAFTLNEHASLYVRQAGSTLALELQSDSRDIRIVDDLPPLDANALQTISTECERQASDIQKAWYSASLDPEESRPKDDEGPDLANLSLSNKPAKSKRPLFFDIAYNYAIAIDTDAIGRRARGDADPDAASVPQQAQKVAAQAFESVAKTVTPSAAASPEQAAGSNAAPAPRKGIWGSLFGGR